jgi:hypothetical protein
MTLVDIKLLFVRDIAEDGTLTAFEDLLRRSAPAWCQTAGRGHRGRDV